MSLIIAESVKTSVQALIASRLDYCIRSMLLIYKLCRQSWRLGLSCSTYHAETETSSDYKDTFWQPSLATHPADNIIKYRHHTNGYTWGSPRHVAIVHTTPIGGRPTFLGGNITGKCTQLTIAKGGDTILIIGYKTMLRGSEQKMFWFVPHLWHSGVH